jgi:hypothetical protein
MKRARDFHQGCVVAGHAQSPTALEEVNYPFGETIRPNSLSLTKLGLRQKFGGCAYYKKADGRQIAHSLVGEPKMNTLSLFALFIPLFTASISAKDQAVMPAVTGRLCNFKKALQSLVVEVSVDHEMGIEPLLLLCAAPGFAK